MLQRGLEKNFFCVIDDVLYTPGLGNILNGITRCIVLEIAQELGIICKEADIPMARALDASEEFFTGTAAEITPIHPINDVVVGQGTLGSVTDLIKKVYSKIITGQSQAY